MTAAKDEDLQSESASPSELAERNAAGSVVAQRRFPEQVFSGAWPVFRFFEADRIFDAGFVQLVGTALIAEKSSCACLVNLDEAALLDCEDQGALIIDSQLTPEEYWTRMTVFDSVKGLSRVGWALGMDRFACASDGGRWCVYCEKTEELAVVAFQHASAVEEFGVFLETVDAVPVTEVFRRPLVPHLGSPELSPEWRSRMLSNYSDTAV